MKRVEYPGSLRLLVAELKRMPGIGPRSAERIGLWMIQSPDAHPKQISDAIQNVTLRIKLCPQCGFFTEDALCILCADLNRDHRQLCVVEQPTDILPLEKTGAFRGYYFSLGGRISPLDHVGPEQLRIQPLLQRIRETSPTEIILALGSDVEGEATASYLASLLTEFPLQLTRIAQGLPAGGGLEHADELTLSRALSGRTAIPRS